MYILNAILVDKENKEITIGEIEFILMSYFNHKAQENLDIYKNLTLKDLNRLVVILESYYEIEHSTIKMHG